MGGYKYKDNEKESLLNLIKDNPDMSNTDLAKAAHRYGICTQRTEHALAQYVAKVKEPEGETPDSDLGLFVNSDAILIADRDACKAAADGFIDALLGHASLYHGRSYDGLRYDIRYINHYMLMNYGDLVAERIDELKAQEGIDE